MLSPVHLSVECLILTAILFSASSLPSQHWIEGLPCDSMDDDLARIQCQLVIRKIDKVARVVEDLYVSSRFSEHTEKIFRRFGPQYQAVTFGRKFLREIDVDLSHMGIFLGLVRTEGAVPDRFLQNAADQLEKAQESVRALWRNMAHHSTFPKPTAAEVEDVLHPYWLRSGTQKHRRMRYIIGFHVMASRLLRIAATFRKEQRILLREQAAPPPERLTSPSAGPEKNSATPKMATGKGRKMAHTSATSDVPVTTSAAPAKTCGKLSALLFAPILLFRWLCPQ